MALPIEDYALIGDCETAALVGRDGSIDWLCWPRFDSEACFAALLGEPGNGRWKIAPEGEPPGVKRRYRRDTLILETEFETAGGTAALIDFMPMRDKTSEIVRIVEGRRGSVPMKLEFVLRFDYGRVIPWVTNRSGKCLRGVAGPHSVTLRSPVRLISEHMQTSAHFTVSAGERVAFILSYQPSHLRPMRPRNPETALASTVANWEDWARQCTYRGPFRDAVIRSLITIKAMTYAPTGGTVAAPTTSLPERAGGIRNWDYRFCWLRDAGFMVSSLVMGGFHQEATAWRDWLLRAIAGTPSQVQPLYGVSGERRIEEWEVPWLGGYGSAKPVRVGNAASAQFQLDLFGNVFDALHIARRHGLGASNAGWALQTALLEHVEQIWNHPDRGIWEVRGRARHFVHSKVMAWVAFDRAIRAVEHSGLDGPVEHWRKIRDAIHKETCARGYNRSRKSFVQSFGSSLLDSALLLIPVVGFLPATDPRMISTVAAIERELMFDGLVRRYDTGQAEDGLPEGEAPFLACSFLLAQCYALQGRKDDATRLFERLVALTNDVGLLSEEYDPEIKAFLGNFPQALSHLSLLNTAFLLEADPSAPETRLDP
jgi:GH15 family glucan-1,4-alpha-glucosidase